MKWWVRNVTHGQMVDTLIVANVDGFVVGRVNFKIEQGEY